MYLNLANIPSKNQRKVLSPLSTKGHHVAQSRGQAVYVLSQHVLSSLLTSCMFSVNRLYSLRGEKVDFESRMSSNVLYDIDDHQH